MILVTGGLGMIGAHTARALTDLGHDVVVTAHGRLGVPTFVEGRVAVERLDVTDRSALLELGSRHRVSDIVHLAGSVPGEDPVDFFRADTAGLLNTLEAARQWEVRRFAVASSLGCYIGRPEVPWHEDLAVPAAPVPHPIVAFKKAVEPLTASALHGTDVRPVILRIGSTWGPLMDSESPFNPIPPYISAVLRGDQPAPVYADDGGDLCYAPDTGRAIASLLDADTLAHDIYNVSNGTPYTGRALVEAVRTAVPDAQVELRPGKSTGPGDSPYLDIARLTEDTDFAAAYDLHQAVAHYVNWRVDNAR